MCDNGELVNVTCPGGTTFSEDDLDCIDASLNPECDIDECLEFINFPDTQTECDSSCSIRAFQFFISQEKYRISSAKCKSHAKF